MKPLSLRTRLLFHQTAALITTLGVFSLLVLWRFERETWREASWAIGLLALVCLVTGLILAAVSSSLLGRTERALETSRRRALRESRRRAEIQKTHAEELERANRELAVQAERLGAVNLALERKNEELDEFAYVASHELQEPLRKIRAFSALLRKDVGGDLPERAEHDLDFICDASGRMQILVQNLLALSRAGRAPLRREPVSLAECARRAMSALSLRIEETDARIALEDLPDVQGDAAMLIQLLQNLIENAMKFCQDHRPVIHLTCEALNGERVFGVQDNGIGVPPRFARQVFAPFRRLHGHGDYPGSGIGLAICHKIIERHGGRLWVEPAPDQGSHFRFTIPPEEGDDT